MAIDYASQVTDGSADLVGIHSHTFELNEPLLWARLS